MNELRIALKPTGYLTLTLSLALAVAGCCHRGQKTEVEARLLDKIVFSELKMAVHKQLDKISDTGTLDGTILNFADTLKRVWENKDFTQRWLTRLLDNRWLENLDKYIARAEWHGLDPEFYHGKEVHHAVDAFRKGLYDEHDSIAYDKLARLLVLSADASLGLYHDLHCGRVEPGYTGSVDILPRRVCGSLPGLLLQDSTNAAVKAAFPDFEPYNQLLKEYSRLLKLSKKVDEKLILIPKKYKPGDTMVGGMLAAVLHKLKWLGYGQWADSLIEKSTIYNPQFSAAVSQFQWAQELEPTGILDKETVEKLNIKRSVVMLRLQANLERWRWLGPANEETKIWVNVASNRVFAWKQDTLKINMKVCSGKNRDEEYYKKLKKSREKDSKTLPPDNLETPLLKAKLTHFVVNPTWFVPKNIAVKEMLPLIKSDPGSLARYDYVLRDPDGEEVDPYSVDWSQVSSRHFPFTIEQRYGEHNSLGKVVVHFPNSYSIFLHDTPAKGVFSWQERHVSHGCVRMEKPFDMIEYITSFSKKSKLDKVLIAAGMEPKLDKKLIKEYKEAKKDSVKFEKFKPEENKFFISDEKIPVYIVYFTCYTSESGAITFTSDTYERDEKMLKEMHAVRRKKPVVKANS